MKIRRTGPFKKNFKKLPQQVQKQAEKQLRIFVRNPYHPSLRTRKMEGHPDIWEGTINDQYRFTFQIEGGLYVLRKIGTHQIYENP